MYTCTRVHVACTLPLYMHTKGRQTTYTAIEDTTDQSELSGIVHVILFGKYTARSGSVPTLMVVSLFYDVHIKEVPPYAVHAQHKCSCAHINTQHMSLCAVQCGPAATHGLTHQVRHSGLVDVEDKARGPLVTGHDHKLRDGGERRERGGGEGGLR